MQHNGKNAKKSKSKVSSTSVFSRGMDVSFSNCFIINPTPLMIEQITGRSNRWNRNKECGNIYIVIDNDKNELVIYKKPIAKEDMWNKYYLPYIEYLKTNIVNGSEISIYQLKEHRINFFENETTKLLNKLIRNNLTEIYKTGLKYYQNKARLLKEEAEKFEVSSGEIFSINDPALYEYLLNTKNEKDINKYDYLYQHFPDINKKLNLYLYH